MGLRSWHGLIPKERLWINLDHIAEEHRQMRFNAHGKRYDECWKAFVNPCLEGRNVTRH